MAWGYLSSKYMLTTTHYAIDAEKVSSFIRIVQLTDLHNSIFGKDNSRLVNKVAKEEPDIIVITGDLLNEDEENTQIATSLISKLSDIAPTYVSFGNHETNYEERNNTGIRKLYTDSGATVLEYNWLDIEVKGQKIRLGGLYGYCLPEKYLKTGEARENECVFLSSFQNTNDTAILLCHMPVCWLINDSLDEWDIDIIFSGHVHGGQIRLPFIGGIWAPDMGRFPGKLCGIYKSKDGMKSLVLSRGLGNREKIPRMWNIPEIVVVDLE